MKPGSNSRREFLKMSSLSVAGYVMLPSFGKIPGAPGQSVALHNIPADKKLDPAWIRSLYLRGNPTAYCKTKNELRYIGMPAGGLHTGTVYLGGDGRLWLWQVFNDDREGIDPKTAVWNDGRSDRNIRSRDGACYVEPALADNKRVLEQGFAIKLDHNGKTVVKELKEEDWDEVIFEATYPVATIRYIDKDLPVDVVMRAGGIFIPLDADDSALPATIFSLHIKNNSAKEIGVSVCGWLENGAHKISAADGDGMRQNNVVKDENHCAVFSSFNAHDPAANAQRDAGSTCIAFIGSNGKVNTDARPWPVSEELFNGRNEHISEGKPSEKLTGSIACTQTLAAGKAMEADYVISWHFNHPLAKLQKLKEVSDGAGYYYGRRFKNAAEVAAYIAAHFRELYGRTLLWHTTYYDSSLPYWFLERALLNIGTIATANTYRFADDRFWGWEGVNACEGTCTHVWQYAQALGRMFPSLERDTRQRVDLGIAMQEDGGIIFRAEYENRPAIDGQAGTILRIYREHQVSIDSSFLQANWDKIKKAVRFMLAQDKNGDGMTDTPMENTLDAVWEGEIAWIVGLCIAAAKAAQMMAEEMNDLSFAGICKEYVEKGSRNMAEKLFNGEYFIHRPDAVQGRKKLGSYNTCHIDQVYGQSWAWQVNLGRLWDKEKTLSALRSLWKYNFAPDVGPYIKTHPGGRPYALDGEAGLVMNTNPHDEPHPYGDNVTWQAGYFNECMTGFEHQVASHMMAEDMTDEALVLTRAIHDRYHAAKRNPFNEIECSDHYARAMASYGTFITACGFAYHGPKGYIRFAPRWNKEDFRAPFTAAQGWGTYRQQCSGHQQEHRIELKYGSLQLNTVSLEKTMGHEIRHVAVKLGAQIVQAKFDQQPASVEITFPTPVDIRKNQVLVISMT